MCTKYRDYDVWEEGGYCISSKDKKKKKNIPKKNNYDSGLIYILSIHRSCDQFYIRVTYMIVGNGISIKIQWSKICGFECFCETFCSYVIRESWIMSY